MGVFKLCICVLAIYCFSSAKCQNEETDEENTPLTTLQAPPVIKPETDEVRNRSSDTNLRVKKLRSAFYLSSQPTRWYPTTSSAPFWATTSPPYWFTTSRAWYHPSTFRIRPHSQPTRFTLPWQFYSSPAQRYRYTTSWYPPYRFTTRRYPAYKTTYLPSMTRWHDHTTNQPYTHTTPPYWWHQRSTDKGYRQSTRWWQPKSTYPHYKTTYYPYFRFTTSYPYARKTTSWWYRSTYPKSTKSWYYQNTTPWWHRSTPSWYHSKYPTSKMSSNNPQTIPWWQRPSTPWYYPKTTYPYYKTTYPYYIHTTGVPRSTPYPSLRTESPSTPYWYHEASKATPNWYHGTTKGTPNWYHGTTKATTSWYNPVTAAIIATKRPIEECQAVRIQIMPVEPDLGPNCLQRLSADDTRNKLLASAVISQCSSAGWNLVVDMRTLQKAYPFLKGSDIYLGETSCTGRELGSVLVFSNGLQECQTTETVTNDKVIYRNELIYAPRGLLFSRHVQWIVDVECDIVRNGSSSAHIHHGVNHTHPHVTGVGNYDVRMAFYSDSNFVHAISGNPIQVPEGNKIYVKVFTTAIDWNIKMKVDTCYTKSDIGNQLPARFDLIRNGCESDRNTHFISQSTHETRFVFQDFVLTPGQEGFDIKCDVTFCAASDITPRCLQTCHPYNIIG